MKSSGRTRLKKPSATTRPQAPSECHGPARRRTAQPWITLVARLSLAAMWLSYAVPKLSYSSDALQLAVREYRIGPSSLADAFGTVQPFLELALGLLVLIGLGTRLVLRALHPAAGGDRGPREVLLAVMHSRWAASMTSPFITLPLLIASLCGLYFTPLFGALMRTWWGHDLMLAHFVGVGLLFYFPLLAVDPAPRKPHPVVGMLELMVGMPFHAFLGIAVMMSTGLITTFSRTRPRSGPWTRWPISPRPARSRGRSARSPP